MSRIQQTIDTLRDREEKAMGLFLTNGFPAPDATLPLLRTMDRGGADFIELGMPFSDPLAEGLPIQRASARALAQGVTMDDAFRTASSFRAESETPLLLMGYINPILRYGVSNFCEAAHSSGVDGLILPDLPPEECAIIDQTARDAGLDMVYLIAPNTADPRIERIDALATAFVYAVSVTGLTGSGLGEFDAIATYLQRARRLVRQNPLLVGFGIQTHADAIRLSTHTDGFIVGSALIKEIEKLWDDNAITDDERLKQVCDFVQTLKQGETNAAS